MRTPRTFVRSTVAGFGVALVAALIFAAGACRDDDQQAGQQAGGTQGQPQAGTPGAQPQVGTPGAQQQVGTPGAQPQVGTPGAQPQAGTQGAQPQAGTPGAQPQVGTPGARPQVGTPGAQQQQTPLRGQGVASGSVSSVDREEGSIEIQGREGSLTLRARPMDLEAVQQGRQATLPYVRFGEDLWYVPTGQAGQAGQAGQQQAGQGRQPQQAGPGGQAGAGKMETATGTVEEVDQNAGTLTVNGEDYQAHPLQIQGLTQGRSVRLSFSEVGGTNWVANIQPAGAGGGAVQQGVPQGQPGQQVQDVQQGQGMPQGQPGQQGQPQRQPGQGEESR